MKLQISEILGKLKDITGEGSVAKKIALLQQHDNPTLRVILRHAFDPTVAYNLPEGIPPFKKNDSPMEMTESSLYSETRKLSYLWLVPSDAALQTLTETQKVQLEAHEVIQERFGQNLNAALLAAKASDEEITAAREAIAAAKARWDKALKAHADAKASYHKAMIESAEIDKKTEALRASMLQANAQLTDRNAPLPRVSNIPKYRLEMLFIQLLESLHADEAAVLLAAKNKTLTKLYPITKEMVKKAFPDLLPAGS